MNDACLRSFCERNTRDTSRVKTEVATHSALVALSMASLEPARTNHRKHGPEYLFARDLHLGLCFDHGRLKEEATFEVAFFDALAPVQKRAFSVRPDST